VTTVHMQHKYRSTEDGWFGFMVYGGYGAKRYFQHYFSYIVVVSFIGGGNRSTRRKPL